MILNERENKIFKQNGILMIAYLNCTDNYDVAKIKMIWLHGYRHCLYYFHDQDYFQRHSVLIKIPVLSVTFEI